MVQAQHNLLVELQHPPNVLNLRRVLLSQAQVSSAAARHARVIAPDLTDVFTTRADLYRELVRSSRDLNGRAGGGGNAAAESQNAASRTRSIQVGAGDESALREFARLCRATNARVAAAIEHGFNDKLYFVAVKLPRLDNEQANGIYPVRQRWMTATPELAAQLLELARERLRPPPAPPHMPGNTDASRVPYERVLSREIMRLGHSGPSR